MKSISPVLIIANYQGYDITIENMDHDGFQFYCEQDFLYADTKIDKIQLQVFNCDAYLYETYQFEVKIALIEKKDIVRKYNVEIVDNKNNYMDVYDMISNLSSLFLDRKIIKSLQDYKDVHEIYPIEKDKNFFDDFTMQRESWISEILVNKEADEFFMGEEVELAFCINNANMYKHFIVTDELDRESFFDIYLSRYGLDKHPIFLNNRITRLYLGNSFCPYQQPPSETMLDMLKKAHNQGFQVTIEYSYLSEDCINKFEELVDKVGEYCKEKSIKIEFVVNDWGVLNYIAKYKEYIEPVLGKMLNKRKKDPRFRWKWLPHNTRNVFNTNNYNNEFVLGCLNEEGIQRIEYESFEYGNSLPKGRHSLHFPFYQMMTSTFCPLRYKISKFKKYIISKNGCKGYCNEIVDLYPMHLNMLGVGNSVLGFDVKIFQSEKYIKDYIKAGINRFVLTLI